MYIEGWGNLQMKIVKNDSKWPKVYRYNTVVKFLIFWIFSKMFHHIRYGIYLYPMHWFFIATAVQIDANFLLRRISMSASQVNNISKDLFQHTLQMSMKTIAKSLDWDWHCFWSSKRRPKIEMSELNISKLLTFGIYTLSWFQYII